MQKGSAGAGEIGDLQVATPMGKKVKISVRGWNVRDKWSIKLEDLVPSV